MDTPSVVPPAPVAPPRPRVSLHRLIPIVIVFLVIGIVAAALFLVRIQGDSLIDRIQASWELKGVTVQLRGEDGIMTAHTLGVFGPKQVRVKNVEGKVIAYEKQGEVSAAVVYTTESGVYQVLALTPEKKILHEGAAPIAGLSVSADSNYIAYSVADEGASGQLLSSWTLYLYDVAQAETVEVGPGYGAQFVVYEGTLYAVYTTATGIAITNPSTGEGFITTLLLPDDTYFAVSVSADGTYFALRDNAQRAWALYSVPEITQGLPLRLQPLKLDVTALQSVIFVGNEIYGISPTWNEMDDRRELIDQRIVSGRVDTQTLSSIYGLPVPGEWLLNK